MDKNVGGVDLEELMRARAELDRERGVETDPDMYSDYGKDHSQPAEPVVETSYEPVQEEPREQVQEEQGYNYNQETNDAYSNEGRSVDADNDGYAVRPGDNEFGWVADDGAKETFTQESQSFASAESEQTESLADAFNFVENNEPSYEDIGYKPSVEESREEYQEPVQEEVQAPAEPDEPKDLNMYDIFAEFEVKENANISSTIDLGAIAAESADPEPKQEEVQEPVVENVVAAEPVVEEKEVKHSAVDDLISELLAGYDLDADPEPEQEEVQEPVVENTAEVVEEPTTETASVPEEVHDAMEQAPADEPSAFDMLSAFEVMVDPEPAPVVEEPKVEESAAEQPLEEVSHEEEVKNFIDETIAHHELIGGEENAIIEEHEDVHVNADDGILDGDKPEEVEVEDAIEETASDEAETTEEAQKTHEDSVSLVHELQNELFNQAAEPTTIPPSAKENKTESVDSGETEVITDYSKLKDILQQELEEAERAEIEKIEEVKAEVVKSDKQFAEIESFNFVDEIVNEEFKESDKLSYLIGKNEEGKCVYGNFKEQYNLVIFGKEQIYTNTLVNSILLSLSLKNEVTDTNFIILDADINSQFEIYNKSSYIFFNRIAKTNKEILDTLIEVSKELDERYNKLASFGVKDIDQYNDAVIEAGIPKMPYLVVVFGNYTKSSQATDNDKIVACLHRVLKYGRIAGIYAVVVATNPI